MRVPIGAALTSDLIGELPANPVAALKAVLGWAWFYWFGPRGTNPLPCLECGRVLLTWLADTPRLNDLVRPIIKEMSLGECNVIGGEPSIQNQLSPGIGFCTKKQIGKIDMGNWRREYRQCYGAWCRQIWDWLCDHHLSFWLFPYLVYSLAIHSVYIYGFYRFLERVKPSLILTDSEHNHPWNCLILVARQLKIPTLQMMHGVIYTSYGYYPLLSDAALCWGEQQRSQMMSFGVQPERLLITGCQRLRRENRCDGKNVRQRLGLPSELPVVMLATNPMPREEWRKLVFTFGDAFRGNDDFVAVVKLHPSERRNSYREEMVRYPEMSLFESAEWSVEESMAACDVVVSHNSGLGNDALVLRRPVVLLDVLKESLSNGRGLAERAGCPVVGSAIELRQIVTQIMTDQDYRQVLREHAEKYVTWFCYAYGQEAARNVVDAVRRRTTK
ncbi:MAG: hypothetical protein WCP12_11060 [bacterium]